MKLLFAAFLAIQSPGMDCAASLRLRGVGKSAARQVRPYVNCLNARLGTPAQLRAACSRPRRKAMTHLNPRKVAAAVRWLDAMVHERAFCETHLGVVA